MTLMSFLFVYFDLPKQVFKIIEISYPSREGMIGLYKPKCEDFSKLFGIFGDAWGFVLSTLAIIPVLGHCHMRAKFSSSPHTFRIFVILICGHMVYIYTE